MKFWPYCLVWGNFTGTSMSDAFYCWLTTSRFCQFLDQRLVYLLTQQISSKDGLARIWLCHWVQAIYPLWPSRCTIPDSRLIASKKLPEDEDIVIAKIEHVLWFHQRCKAEFWRCCVRDTQESPEWRCWLGGMFIGKELTGILKTGVKFCSSSQLAAKMPVFEWIVTMAWLCLGEDPYWFCRTDGRTDVSQWPEVVQMRTSTTTATIKELDRIFAQQGYPKVNWTIYANARARSGNFPFAFCSF